MLGVGGVGLVVCGGIALAVLAFMGKVREAAVRMRQEQDAIKQKNTSSQDPQQNEPWGPNPWAADPQRPNPTPRGMAPKQIATSAYKKQKPFDSDPKLAQGGTGVYLADLEPFDVHQGPWPLGRNGALGSEDDKWVIVNGVFSDHALSMHPPLEGAMRASFAVGGLTRTLKGHVALNDAEDDNPYAPVTFAVFKDGEEVWRSKPLQSRGESLPFRVDVSGAKVITLETSCKGTSSAGCYCVWLDPMLEK